MAIYSMLAALMFCSKVIMDALPNIHLIGTLIMVYTLVFRARALIPLYLFIFMAGLYGGFGLWWLPYLYIWAILWAITMLLPKKMPNAVAAVVYPVVCGLFGIFFGTLYAPVWAIVAGFNLEQTIAWIVSGLSFDVLHAIGNAAIGCLVLPLSKILLKLENSTHR